MAGRELMRGALSLDMVAYIAVPESWPAKRRAAALMGVERPTGKPDWDNVAKVVDSLNGVVWPDDSAVVDGRLRKFYADTPRLEVTVEHVFE
jgi:Holliday junction resolvase RusA-like endonuclease